MPRRIVWLTLPLAACAAVLVWRMAPPPPAEAPPEPVSVEPIIERSLAAWHVPGAAVAVVRNDRPVFVRGFGVKELGRPDPVTPDTLFPLASCTKAFTTTAMAMLVDEKKIAWDDPVRKHVGFFHLSDPLADGDVRLRDLVTHRTGLAPNDLLWYRAPWGQEETIRRIGHVPLKNPFRTAFQYQTTMFTTAGWAVHHAAGVPWQDFVRERIFQPLGMKSANFTTRAALAAADHASPHRMDDRGEIRVIPWYPMETPEPAGSINASARDLIPWVRFQLGDGTFDGKRLVSQENLAETHTPQMVIRMEGPARDNNPDTTQMSYGMAWVLQDYHGHGLASHAGAIDGFRAHITLAPRARLGIIILTNLDRTNMNLALSNTLLDRILDLPTRDWDAYLQEQAAQEARAAYERAREREALRRPDVGPSLALDAYTGTYEDAGYGRATVTRKGGALVWKWSSFTAPLEPFAGDTFVAANAMLGNPRVEFVLDAGRRVRAMTVKDVMEVEFKRAK